MASTIASLFGPSPEQIEYDQQQARRVQQENRYTTNLAGLKGDLPGMATGYVAGMGIGEGLGQAAQGIFGMEPTKDPALARSKKTRELFSQFEDADFNNPDVLSRMARAFVDGGLQQEGLSLQQAASDIRSNQPERFFTATGKSLMERDPVRYEGLLEDATYEVSDKTGLPKELVKGKEKPKTYEAGNLEIPESSTNVTNAANDILRLLDNETWHSPVSGRMGSIVRMSDITKAGTDALTYEEAVVTLQANIGFDALSAMREASPTGGALGQVSELELKQLNRSITSLNPDLSPDQMRTSIARILKKYNYALLGFPPEVLSEYGFDPRLSGYEMNRDSNGELVEKGDSRKTIELNRNKDSKGTVRHGNASSRYDELNKLQ